MTKKIMMTISIILLMVGIASADPFLAADDPVSFIPAVCQVEINGTIQAANCTVEAGAVKFLDLTGFGTGNYTFRARWHDGSGWWSEWSVPFVVTKPKKPGNVRVK